MHYAYENGCRGYECTAFKYAKTEAQFLREIHLFLLLLYYISHRETAARLDLEREFNLQVFSSVCVHAIA